MRATLVIAAMTVIGCGSSRDDSLFRGTSGGAGNVGGTTSSGGTSSVAGGTSSGGAAAGGTSNAGTSSGGTFQNDASLTGGSGGAARTDSGLSDGSPFAPGMVLCGGTACDVVTQPYPNVCCVTDPNVYPYIPTTCMPALTGCLYGGVMLTCDDASDCAPGEKCCLETTGSVCASICTSTQLCRLDSECASGSCLPFAAAPDYSVCQ